MTLKRWMSMGSLGLVVTFCLACTGMAEPGEAVVEVEECSKGADVDDTTFIVWEFKDSVHEMITCGSLTFQLILALLDTAEDLLTNPSGVPSAFSYADGVLTTTGEGVSMDVMFLYGDDTPAGTPGEVVVHDLFDPESYLVGASSSTEDDVVTVSFDKPGPLASLLGRGSKPKSPQSFTDDDLLDVAENFSSLEIDAVIYVDHEQQLSTIIYHIDSPAVTIYDMLVSQEMNMKMVSASGERPDLTQELSPVLWDVDYGELVGTLDGEIDAEVIGGPFDFLVEFDYLPTVVEPLINITCLDR